MPTGVEPETPFEPETFLVAMFPLSPPQHAAFTWQESALLLIDVLEKNGTAVDDFMVEMAMNATKDFGELVLHLCL